MRDCMENKRWTKLQKGFMLARVDVHHIWAMLVVQAVHLGWDTVQAPPPAACQVLPVPLKDHLANLLTEEEIQKDTVLAKLKLLAKLLTEEGNQLEIVLVQLKHRVGGAMLVMVKRPRLVQVSVEEVRYQDEEPAL
uniref:Uncharacterized protein n=1 Tax=Cacopsylla melanoneura TaxID=428564 RepID=A0A8D8R7D5_9HEMI